MNDYAKYLVRELTKQGEDPDWHPGIRELFLDAAKLIEHLSEEIAALHQHGSDAG